MQQTDSRRVYISNTSSVVSLGPISGKAANKIYYQLGARHAVLGGYDTIVLPRMPEQFFLDYLRELGAPAHVLVPTTVNPEAFTMVDALKDPVIQEVVRRAHVSLYAPHPELERQIKAHGGSCDESNATILDMGLKTRFDYYFGDISRDLLITPKGSSQEGLEAIVNEVLRLLSAGACKVVIRTARGGGGIGFYRCYVGDDPATVTQRLAGVSADTSARVEPWIDGILGQPTVYIDGSMGLLATTTQLTLDGDYLGSQLPCPESVCASTRLLPVSMELFLQLVRWDYLRPGGFDLGVLEDLEPLVVFEFNNRRTALQHQLAIAELILGMPFAQWSGRGYGMLSLDVFKLSEPHNFKSLFDRLYRAHLIARPGDPAGVTISIPPYDGIVGIVILSKYGHASCVELFNQVNELIGGQNVFDQPLCLH